MHDHVFFEDGESAFSPEFIEGARTALLTLCEALDRSPDADWAELYGHTQAMAETLNELMESGVDIETDERESIADELEQVCAAYGFSGVDLEQALENRAW